jgi:hypothetical protein
MGVAAACATRESRHELSAQTQMEGEASRHKEIADAEVKKSATMVRPRADHKCACVLTLWRTCMTFRAGPVTPRAF